MERPHYREGASGWEPFGVATAAQHNQARRDRPLPPIESPNRSRQPSDLSRWGPGRERPEDGSELYQGSLYEPPYSTCEAAVGLTVLVVGSLLFRWLWGD